MELVRSFSENTKKLTQKKKEKSIPSSDAAAAFPTSYFLQLDNKITPNTAEGVSPPHPLTLSLSANTFDKYLKRIPVYREILNLYLLKYFISGYSAL